MTAFGKLLVFLNLVFSVVTGALIVTVFVTRANWKSAYEDAAKKATAAEAAYKAEKSAHENDLRQKDSGSASLQQELATSKANLVAANDEIERNRKLAEDQTKIAQAARDQQTKLEEEMKQIKLERTTLATEQNELRTKLVNLQKDLQDQREVAVLADLEAKNLKQRNTRLLGSVEELTVKIQQLEQSGLAGLGAGSSGGDAGSILNPPPKPAPPGVQGKVTGVGERGTSLAQISIGSDSGISPGNVLTVFKGNEYKGDLKITAVNPKTAVGSFQPAKKNMTISVDDSVITSFGGVSN